jgi:hypothetical protein
MKLNGLISLYNDMKKNNIDRYRFDYQNGKGKFDIFFFIDEQPFILLFGARSSNFSFELEVKNGFNINATFDNETYTKLLKFLEIKYSKDNPFRPNKFFQNFNQNIPFKTNKYNIPKPHQIIKYRQNVEESEKIYFFGWLDNDKKGNQVSEDNLEKTKQILGIKAYERCKYKNISSRWTDDESKQKDFCLQDEQDEGSQDDAR